MHSPVINNHISHVMGIPFFPPIGPIPGIDPYDPFDPLNPFNPFDPFSGIPIIHPQPPPAETRKLKNPAAKPYFLPPHNDSDLMKFRGTAWEADLVTPIIDGEAIFFDLESKIEDAEKSVLIAFWAFDPEMIMVTDHTRSWGQLLIDKANEGLVVRILWTDFDPGLQPLEHALAWKRYAMFVNAAASIPIDNFQIVCSHHEAEIPDTIMGQAKPELYDTVAAAINKKAIKLRQEIFKYSPGMWDKINFDIAKNELVPQKPKTNYPGWPAVHHQKTVIVDGKFAYTGGLNVTAQYLDKPKHDKPELPWHDAFVRVEGSIAIKDFIKSYVGLWNQERVRAEAFLKNAFAKLNISASLVITTRPTTDLAVSMFPPVVTSTVAPIIPCQVRRTVSTAAGSNLFGVPKTVRQDILDGYLLNISLAEKYIYIENQYFREKKIGDAIIARHKVNPNLRTIIVLPKVAEEFLKSAGDEISQHGAALQWEILDDMQKAIKDKLGLYTLVRKDNALIYVHSKLMLIDDKFASIGSANSNPRSYFVDTELDFTWYDEKTVPALRQKLWNEILGKPSDLKRWKPLDFIKKWSAIADKNITGAASKQKGFVIPFANTTKGTKHSLPIDPFT